MTSHGLLMFVLGFILPTISASLNLVRVLLGYIVQDQGPV